MSACVCYSHSGLSNWQSSYRRIHDKDSMPRAWTGKENVRKITKEARDAALKLLAALAAIRLDEKTNKIESILSSALTDAPTSKGREIAANTDPLASSSWEETGSSTTQRRRLMMSGSSCHAYDSTTTEELQAKLIVMQEEMQLVKARGEEISRLSEEKLRHVEEEHRRIEVERRQNEERESHRRQIEEERVEHLRLMQEEHRHDMENREAFNNRLMQIEHRLSQTTPPPSS